MSLELWAVGKERERVCLDDIPSLYFWIGVILTSSELLRNGS